VARGIDHAAAARGADRFGDADEATRRAIVAAFATGVLTGGVWDELPAATAWTVVMRAVLAAFYSHPWAWNEIGFGGPAYPRGYMRLAEGPSSADPDEAREAYELDPVGDARRRGLP
jgi:Gluconate 2-dehydrogenase subunit 3